MDKQLSLKEIEKISKALGDPYRLQIMQTVQKSETCTQCVAIVEMFDLAQSTISHHINLLVDADLLLASKEGRNVHYQVNKEVFGAYIKFLNPFKG
jgi:ArsR family transcriptional regulator